MDIGSYILRLAAEVVAETLWPTRCALCDVPDDVLCASCIRDLPYLDWWQACPHCGSAFGLVQCDLCNPTMLARIGREELPFAGCASAVSFSDSSGRIVRVYKDQGERRLAGVMAQLMTRAVSPAWSFDAVTFIPATKAAMRHRGFDHAELLAHEVASRLRVECIRALDRPQTLDQRALSGRERIANLSNRFHAIEGVEARRALLLVDDVFTTGATLCAATDALKSSCADIVYCLTFARV
jgi:ComF family protein